MAVTSPPDQNSVASSSATPPGQVGSLAQMASERNAVPSPAKNSDGWWTFADAPADAQYPIDAVRWNKLYPYQLLVVKLNEDGTTYSPYSSRRWSLNDAATGWNAKDPGWEFTLPVPPESMTISMPFASEVKATLEGVVEEHGGAPFRMIAISGTTGVQPLRQNALQGPGDRTVDIQPGVIPAGTIQAVGAAVDTALRLVPTPNLMPASVTDTDGKGTVGRGSGYYQFRLLQLFLERYAEAKQTAAGKYLRLAFAVWKDQAVYLVTPQTFEVTRSASAPLSYSYRINLKAWRRVQLNASPAPIATVGLPSGGPGLFPAILEGLAGARDTLAKLRPILQAVRSDIDQALLEPMREAVLFAKDAVGASITLADLPQQAIRDARSAALDAEREAGRLSGVTLGLISPAEAGIMATALDGTPLTSYSPQSARGRNKFFDTPAASFDIFAQLEAKRLRLSPQTQTAITQELDRVRAMRASDFTARRKKIESVAFDFADAIGMGSSVADSVLNRVPVATTVRQPSDDDLEALWALQSAIGAMDRLILSQQDAYSRLEAVEYVAGLARSAGIAFTTPTSKFAVPFPVGGSLERLAVQYLGDPNRWHEIATLNGLRAPYVDEVGFTLPLLVNAAGNTVHVADASNLFVGQPVSISSSSQPRVSRRIQAIDRVAEGFTRVVLNGDADLDVYTVAQGASLHAYLPDTVNSSQQLFIPSSRVVSEELAPRDIPGLASFNTMLEVGGVDMALDSNNQLVVTPDGDTPYVVGLQNLIQQVRIVFATARGSLLQHPEFGLLTPAGISTADLDAKQLLASTQAAFSQDPDFSGVFYASVSKNGPIARQVIHVGVKGLDQLLPVGLEIVR